MMNEAVEEHHLVHVLIKELKKLKPADEIFQAKFKVLGELVKHHIGEEEGEMLPKAEKSDSDWETLETAVMKRKEALVTKGATGEAKNGIQGPGLTRIQPLLSQEYHQGMEAALWQTGNTIPPRTYRAPRAVCSTLQGLCQRESHRAH